MDVAQLMLDAGIKKFKCASIAEAEMLAMAAAPDVLLAYQPVGPKLQRFIQLIQKYPATIFSCLVDNTDMAVIISREAVENHLVISAYIDLDVGMHRTGIAPLNGIALFEACVALKGIKIIGIHAYDGHLRSPDIQQRTIDCDKAYEQVTEVRQALQQMDFDPVIIAGGSPTFPIHAKRKEVECSPGTFVYWDRNYQQTCSEQNFEPAALVLARVVSLPGLNRLCIDLGHKSIASENELHNRVYFLNAPDLKFIGHSEEHLVAEALPGHTYKTGDVLYGLPFHICPTVALYERAVVVENNGVTSEWKNIARDRKITV